MARTLWIPIGRSRLIVEWTSPKHVEGHHKWLLYAYRFIGIGAVVWSIRLLGLRLVLYDRWNSILTEREIDQLTDTYIHSRIADG